MFLADELLEGTWAHARSKRRRALCAHKIDIFLLFKKIGHEKKYGAHATFASHFGLSTARSIAQCWEA
jgi:hypothetical protein